MKKLQKNNGNLRIFALKKGYFECVSPLFPLVVMFILSPNTVHLMLHKFKNIDYIKYIYKLKINVDLSI